MACVWHVVRAENKNQKNAVETLPSTPWTGPSGCVPNDRVPILPKRILLQRILLKRFLLKYSTTQNQTC